VWVSVDVDQLFQGFQNDLRTQTQPHTRGIFFGDLLRGVGGGEEMPWNPERGGGEGGASSDQWTGVRWSSGSGALMSEPPTSTADRTAFKGPLLHRPDQCHRTRHAIRYVGIWGRGGGTGWGGSTLPRSLDRSLTRPRAVSLGQGRRMEKGRDLPRGKINSIKIQNERNWFPEIIGQYHVQTK